MSPGNPIRRSQQRTIKLSCWCTSLGPPYVGKKEFDTKSHLSTEMYILVKYAKNTHLMPVWDKGLFLPFFLSTSPYATSKKVIFGYFLTFCHFLCCFLGIFPLRTSLTPRFWSVNLFFQKKTFFWPLTSSVFFVSKVSFFCFFDTFWLPKIKKRALSIEKNLA